MAEEPRRIIRRTRTEDSEPEPEPRRGLRRAAAESETEEASRGRRRRVPRDGDNDKGPDLKGGWGEYNRQREATKGWADRFEPTEEEVLVKFFTDEPIVSYRQHWIDEAPGARKSFICLEDDCPLCNVGDNPTFQTVFAVIDLSDEKPVVKTMKLGVKAAEALKKLAGTPQAPTRNGPLSKSYWAISKSGKKTSVQWNFTPVKERDLQEEWDMDPLTDDEMEILAKKVPTVRDVAKTDSRATLQELVDEHLS